MRTRLEVRIHAPFALGDEVAQVDLEDGSQRVFVLRDGAFDGDLPGRAERLRLLEGPAPEGEEQLVFGAGDRSAAEPEGQPPESEEEVCLVEVDQLYGAAGIQVPEDGRLAVQLVWGGTCRTDPRGDQPEGRRFGTREHFACARYVGRDRTGPHDRALSLGGIDAPFDHQTLLPVGNHELRFGQLIGLGGDFFAHLDRTAVHAFPDAWPELKGLAGWLAGDYRDASLADESAEDLAQLLAIVAGEEGEVRPAEAFARKAFGSLAGHFPARRYLALASQNHCHFACPRPGNADGDNRALAVYRQYHARALSEALIAGGHGAQPGPADRRRALLRALSVEAFGCHFFTDLFASGHMRVPRTLLHERYGLLRGALKMTKSMHDEDNLHGLWVTTGAAPAPGRPRTVWLARGDGMLLADEARAHLRMVQEAVRRSAAEVFAAFAGLELPADERGSALIPVALPPGTRPRLTDVGVEGESLPADARPNGWPLYWFDADGTVIRRLGEPDENRYRPIDQPRAAQQELSPA